MLPADPLVPNPPTRRRHNVHQSATSTARPLIAKSMLISFAPLRARISPVRAQRYNHLFSVNTKTSHYLLSKVFRAKEALDIEHPDDVQKWREENPELAKQAEELVQKTSRTDAASRAKAGAAPAGGEDKGEGDASRRRDA